MLRLNRIEYPQFFEKVITKEIILEYIENDSKKSYKRTSFFDVVPKELIPVELFDDTEFFNKVCHHDLSDMILYNVEIFRKNITRKIFEDVLLVKGFLGSTAKKLIITELGMDFYTGLFTDEFCMKYIKKQPDYAFRYAFDIIPESKLTVSVIEPVVFSKNYKLIRELFNSYIYRFLDDERIREQVLFSKYEPAWSYIDERYPGYIEANRYEAVATKSIKFIINNDLTQYTEKFLTAEMFLRAIKNNRMNLRYLDSTNIQMMNRKFPNEVDVICQLILLMFHFKMKHRRDLEYWFESNQEEFRTDFENKMSFIRERLFTPPYLLLAYRLGIISRGFLRKKISKHLNLIYELKTFNQIYFGHPVRFFVQEANTFTSNTFTDRDFSLKIHKSIELESETFTIRDALKTLN